MKEKKRINKEIDVLKDLTTYLSPSRYVNSLFGGNNIYPFQTAVLAPEVEQLLLCCARQSGKSTIVCGLATFNFKTIPGSLTVIVAPTELQAKENLRKIKDFLRLDPDIRLKRSSASEVEMEGTGSRIICLPGTDNSTRGFSAPQLIIGDEVGFFKDGQDYRVWTAISPMQVGVVGAKVVMLTTPNGQNGLFWDLWDNKTNLDDWGKILVTPKYMLDESKTDLVDYKTTMTEKKYMDLRGIKHFLSTRHEYKFLKRKLGEMPYQQFEQEYLCKFLESGGSLFDMKFIMASFNEDITPLLTTEDQFNFSNNNFKELDL